MIKEIKYNRTISLLENELNGLIVNDFVEYACYYNDTSYRLFYIDNKNNVFRVGYRFLEKCISYYNLDKDTILDIIIKYYEKTNYIIVIR